MVFTDLALSDVFASYLDHSAYGMPREGNALRLMWNDGVTFGEFRIAQEGQYIEAFEFADGTTLSSIGVDANGNPVYTGTAGDDVILGGAADEVLAGGLGSDRLTGGAGSDTYLFGRGDGADVIDDASNDTSSTDLVRFGAGIATDQLWFARSGDDLSVSIVGQADSVLIDDWYLGSQHRVDAFELASGESLEAAQVQSLVDAMAAFGAPPPGSERIPPATMDQLGSTIAGAWTPSV